MVHMMFGFVVADTTKVQIFKQITTRLHVISFNLCCCWYHKGTNFQANHNRPSCNPCKRFVVADTTKVQIFKQITTPQYISQQRWGCCWYHKGTNFQANHNIKGVSCIRLRLLLIPQRYKFSSKSQRVMLRLMRLLRCCWYHKGTNFQANHNR